MTGPKRTLKALAAWTELNDRQQGTLAVMYDPNEWRPDESRAMGWNVWPPVVRGLE
jgi:hypothetical protein